MRSFEPFLSLLRSIPDPRRAEGKRYTQAHVLLFSILAIVTGANSYRGIRTFIRVHHTRLNAAFGLSWKHPPAYTSIRTILTGLNAADLETAFRAHAADLDAARSAGNTQRTIALDGKVLRGSFDAFHDRRVQQLLSAFATDTMLVLAHIDIDDKSNEIPAAQALLQDLDVSRHVVTLDAMHCQKNIRSRSIGQNAPDRATEKQPESSAPRGHRSLRGHDIALQHTNL